MENFPATVICTLAEDEDLARESGGFILSTLVIYGKATEIKHFLSFGDEAAEAVFERILTEYNAYEEPEYTEQEGADLAPWADTEKAAARLLGEVYYRQRANRTANPYERNRADCLIEVEAQPITAALVAKILAGDTPAKVFRE